MNKIENIFSELVLFQQNNQKIFTFYDGCFTLQMITALLLLISCTLDVLLAGLHLVAVHDQLLYCITARLQLHSIW